MKIKEIMEQTGLTDRAVRLYIENGLVTPENRKSYTGRNNYVFTEKDAKALGQIALLRKADFSIEQIKALQQGGETAKATLHNYLTCKKESLTTGQKIVSALEALPADQAPTMEEICGRIEEGLQGASLPIEDLKPGRGEQWEKWLMRIVSGLVFGFFLLVFLGVRIDYQERFPFPKLYRSPFNYVGVGGLLLLLAFPVIVLFLYRKYQLNQNKRRKRRIAAVVMMVLEFLIATCPILLAALALVPPVYSETNDPENYLVLGSYARAYSDSIYKLFPATIPKSAVSEDSRWFPPDRFPETTKYHYDFEDVIDPQFDIYGEWVLPREEFDQELLRIRTYFPDGPNQQVQWGNWVCMSFTSQPLEKAEEYGHYYYLIFAYCEERAALRYIASYCMDGGEEDMPYFLGLDW